MTKIKNGKITFKQHAEQRPIWLDNPTDNEHVQKNTSTKLHVKKKQMVRSVKTKDNVFVHESAKMIRATNMSFLRSNAMFLFNAKATVLQTRKCFHDERVKPTCHTMSFLQHTSAKIHIEKTTHS